MAGHHYPRSTFERCELAGQLFLLNWFNGRRAWETDVYPRIVDLLNGSGLDVVCPANLTRATLDTLNSQAKPGDVAVAHQPEVALRAPGVRSYGEPAGIPLRAQRLAFLERQGVPVMEWRDAVRQGDPNALFETWNTEAILLKQNGTAQSNGLTVLRPGDALPAVAAGDLFCSIITDDPHTYKVDFFHDTILGSYVKETPFVLAPHFRQWIVGDNREQRDFPHQNRHFFPLSPPWQAMIARLGRALADAGGGYSSIDLMRSADEFRAIELNTTHVSTKYGWLERPEQYAREFSTGLRRLWRDQAAATRQG